MAKKFKFNRFELSGSIGDLGTLIPIGMGMIMVNKLSPSGIFLSVGLMYIVAGWYYGIPISVQPMKIIASYAIATSMTSNQIQTSGIMMFICLLLIGFTGTIDTIEKYISKTVVKGIQLSTGIILMNKGMDFILGKSSIQLIEQSYEPYLSIQSLGNIPMSIIIGIMSFIIILLLLNNKKIPAGVIVISLGIVIGLFFGINDNNIVFENIGANISKIIPLKIPKTLDVGFILITLVIPQLPMTIGNAVIANRDLSIAYFGNDAKKVTNKALCITMAFGNLLASILNGMPICHGAGGLAAHYRFGARSVISNLFIGTILVILSILFGDHILSFFKMIPMGTLGPLLIFSGSQLTFTIINLKKKEDIFVVFMMLAVTLTSNFSLGFLSGVVITYILRFYKIKI